MRTTEANAEAIEAWDGPLACAGTTTDILVHSGFADVSAVNPASA